MYKVMIIDDEPIVRWGIRDLLNWEAEGFELCEDGRDGKDGLGKLLECWPDLVLVDIKMPGMNGIDLIRAAREEKYNGYFIILTGYSEFEFAKSAVALGVREYLLKPVDEEELLRCVRKLRAEMVQVEGERRYHSVNEALAREELFRSIILHTDSRESQEERMKRLGISFGDEILCAAVLTDKKGLYREAGQFSERVREFLKEAGLYDEVVMMDNRVVLVRRNMEYKKWVEALSRRNDTFKKKCREGLLIAVGHNVSKWYDLYYSHEFALFLLEQEFLFSQYDVLSINTIEEQQMVAENPPTEHFVMLIEVGDMEGIQECVENFEAYCRRKLMKELDIKIQIIYNLMSIRNGIEKKYGNLTGRYAELMEKVNRAEMLDQLMDLYCQVLQDMCRHVGNGGSDTVIKRMYYYMEKNYYQDLKVESFARMFNYNSNYLGKIFRKEIGDSFNNILDSIRIANAKRLLAETDKKVCQISKQVGYANIDYFYLKFKKYVGTSPKEYRKELIKE